MPGIDVGCRVNVITPRPSTPIPTKSFFAAGTSFIGHTTTPCPGTIIGFLKDEDSGIIYAGTPLTGVQAGHWGLFFEVADADAADHYTLKIYQLIGTDTTGGYHLRNVVENLRFAALNTTHGFGLGITEPAGPFPQTVCNDPCVAQGAFTPTDTQISLSTMTDTGGTVTNGDVHFVKKSWIIYWYSLPSSGNPYTMVINGNVTQSGNIGPLTLQVC